MSTDNKHRLYCTCANCSGKGMSLQQQAEWYGHNNGTRRLNQPDRDIDKQNVMTAELKQADKKL